MNKRKKTAKRDHTIYSRERYKVSISPESEKIVNMRQKLKMPDLATIWNHKYSHVSKISASERICVLNVQSEAQPNGILSRTDWHLETDFTSKGGLCNVRFRLMPSHIAHLSVKSGMDHILIVEICFHFSCELTVDKNHLTILILGFS